MSYLRMMFLVLFGQIQNIFVLFVDLVTQKKISLRQKKNKQKKLLRTVLSIKVRLNGSLRESFFCFTV